VSTNAHYTTWPSLEGLGRHMWGIDGLQTRSISRDRIFPRCHGW